MDKERSPQEYLEGWASGKYQPETISHVQGFLCGQQAGLPEEIAADLKQSREHAPMLAALALESLGFSAPAEFVASFGGGQESAEAESRFYTIVAFANRLDWRGNAS